MEARLRETQLGPAEFAAMSAIHQSVYPETPGSAGELERGHRVRVRDLPYFFAFIEVGTENIGYCALKPTVILKEPGLHLISFALSREYCGRGIEEQVLGRIEDEATRLGALKLGTRARTDFPTLVALYDNHGFARVQTDLITALDLVCFDPSDYDGLFFRLRREGIEIVDAVELSRTGDGWITPAYELNTALMQDVLIPGEYEPRTLDQWAEEMLDPAETDLSLQIYGRTGSELIGETCLFVLDNGSGNLVTGLTGVLPAYRRRGIATALKVRSLAVAKSRGLVTVFTGNERHIPMYKLNLKLGYTDRYEDITFWR
jgi:GNAT superfamily N-acetyltransferase